MLVKILVPKCNITENTGISELFHLYILLITFFVSPKHSTPTKPSGQKIYSRIRKTIVEISFNLKFQAHLP